jgi:hypothetical protein
MRGEGEGGSEGGRSDECWGEGGGIALFILSPSPSRAPPVPARASALSPLSSCRGSYVPGPGTFSSRRSVLHGTVCVVSIASIVLHVAHPWCQYCQLLPSSRPVQGWGRPLPPGHPTAPQPNRTSRECISSMLRDLRFLDFETKAALPRCMFSPG